MFLKLVLFTNVSRNPGSQFFPCLVGADWHVHSVSCVMCIPCLVSWRNFDFNWPRLFVFTCSSWVNFPIFLGTPEVGENK